MLSLRIAIVMSDLLARASEWLRTGWNYALFWVNPNIIMLGFIHLALQCFATSTQSGYASFFDAILLRIYVCHIQYLRNYPIAVQTHSGYNESVS